MNHNPFFPGADGYTPPRFRATIQPERLQVTPWNPGLKRISPAEAERVTANRTAVADLWVQESAGDSELIVRWLVEPADPERCPALLREWATSLGYSRLWLPSGAPLALDRADAPAEVPVRCEWCGWQPDTPDLAKWQRIQKVGIFPAGCNRCGSQLPQWIAGVVEVDEPHVSTAERADEESAAQPRDAEEVA